MRKSTSKTPQTPAAARRNISRLAELEQQFEEKRTSVDRLIARIASSTGSLPFLAFHIFWFGIWVLLNTGTILRRKFDPYPFELLALMVACEAVLLSTIVLIEQNWLARRSEHFDRLHLQVNLLAE